MSVLLVTSLGELLSVYRSMSLNLQELPQDLQNQDEDGGDSIYKFLYGDQARFFSYALHLDLKHAKMGTVATASAGENPNASSQFYTSSRDDLDYLDGKHTVLSEGRPYKDIRLKDTYVLDDPFDDPTPWTDLIPGASPEGKPKDEAVDDVRLEDDRVPMDEKFDVGELEEVIRTKEACSRAVTVVFEEQQKKAASEARSGSSIFAGVSIFLYGWLKSR
ncbi:hypothetical protein Dimus_005017 [Dionaea muscipula]